jgi:two-component system sensor histidine kinase BaeS
MMNSTVHEIRNQLAVAVANIEAFIDGKIKPTPDRLNSVLQALLEVDVLIDDLRSVAPRQPASLLVENVDICELIQTELIAIEASAAAAGIDVRFEHCATKHHGCAAFTCDRGQVIQLVKNLLLNALKYTPPGGFIDVDCRREPGVIALSVSDDGPGVRREERQTIFAPGVRGSAAGTSSGSGIGLTVVKQIVDAHGGTVSVDRSELGGAHFIVRLPGTITSGDTDCEACVSSRVKTA